MYWGDDRVFWVVWGGQIRFTIEGQQPFVATKGFLVQVPQRVRYSMETIGSEPSLALRSHPCRHPAGSIRAISPSRPTRRASII